jgi:hypothetical protein
LQSDTRFLKTQRFRERLATKRWQTGDYRKDWQVIAPDACAHRRGGASR